MAAPRAGATRAGRRAGQHANRHADGYADAERPPFSPKVNFPYGFPPPPGEYRIFVQIKRAGKIETGVFDARVPVNQPRVSKVSF